MNYKIKYNKVNVKLNLHNKMNLHTTQWLAFHRHAALHQSKYPVFQSLSSSYIIKQHHKHILSNKCDPVALT